MNLKEGREIGSSSVLELDTLRRLISMRTFVCEMPWGYIVWEGLYLKGSGLFPRK